MTKVNNSGAKKTTRTSTRAAASATPSTPKVKRGEHLPLYARVLRNVDRLTVHNGRLAKIQHPKAHSAHTKLTHLIEGLREVAAMVQEVPADALAAAKEAARTPRSGKAKLEAGALVSVKPPRRGDYEGLISADEMNELEVVSVQKKGKAICKVKGGTEKLFFKTADLEVRASA